MGAEQYFSVPLAFIFFEKIVLGDSGDSRCGQAYYQKKCSKVDFHFLKIIENLQVGS